VREARRGRLRVGLTEAMELRQVPPASLEVVVVEASVRVDDDRVAPPRQPERRAGTRVPS